MVEFNTLETYGFNTLETTDQGGDLEVEPAVREDAGWIPSRIYKTLQIGNDAPKPIEAR